MTHTTEQKVGEQAHNCTGVQFWESSARTAVRDPFVLRPQISYPASTATVLYRCGNPDHFCYGKNEIQASLISLSPVVRLHLPLPIFAPVAQCRGIALKTRIVPVQVWLGAPVYGHQVRSCRKAGMPRRQNTCSRLGYDD